MERKPECPPDARRGTSKPLEVKRSLVYEDVDLIVLEGLSEAIKEGRIKKKEGETYIKAYKEKRTSED